jgi:hypothetical protein
MSFHKLTYRYIFWTENIFNDTSSFEFELYSGKRQKQPPVPPVRLIKNEKIPTVHEML